METVGKEFPDIVQKEGKKRDFNVQSPLVFRTAFFGFLSHASLAVCSGCWLSRSYRGQECRNLTSSQRFSDKMSGCRYSSRKQHHGNLDEICNLVKNHEATEFEL